MGLFLCRLCLFLVIHSPKSTIPVCFTTYMCFLFVACALKCVMMHDGYTNLKLSQKQVFCSTLLRAPNEFLQLCCRRRMGDVFSSKNRMPSWEMYCCMADLYLPTHSSHRNECGGFKYFIFSIFTAILAELIQFDDRIFQMGWFNHQLP